jgi:hypothetical protein
MANDHTVPQTYLKGFASDDDPQHPYTGSMIYAYDKTYVSPYPKTKLQPRPINLVACEKNFETVTPGHADESKVKEFAKKLHEVEQLWPDTRERVSRIAEKGRAIDSGLRAGLADFISCQFIRTRSFRDFWQSGRELVMARGFAPIPRGMVDGKLSEDQIKAYHADLLLGELQAFHAAYFASRSWLVGVNTTAQPFFTSDHPVAVGESPYKPSHSIWAFPVTSKLILVMGERNGDCVEVFPAEKEIDWYNKFQISFSHKWVFSSVDHMEQCRSYCVANRHICDPDTPAKAGVALVNKYAKGIEAQITAYRERTGGK